MIDVLYDCDGFEWDEGNLEKNWYLHEVTESECEEMFFNIPLFIAHDKEHSWTEVRYYALGQSNRNRRLFVVFTVRQRLIRVISARDMTEREAILYERRTKHYSRVRQ